MRLPALRMAIASMAPEQRNWRKVSEASTVRGSISGFGFKHLKNKSVVSKNDVTI